MRAMRHKNDRKGAGALRGAGHVSGGRGAIEC